MANEAVSRFTGSHSFVSGVIILAIGVAGIIGSVSGNLASMISALIDPTNLYTVTQQALGGPTAVGLPPSGGEPSSPSSPSLPGAPALPGNANPPSISPLNPSLPGIGELPIIGA